MKESAGKLFIFSFITQYLRKSTSITSMFIRVVQKLASLVSKDIKKTIQTICNNLDPRENTSMDSNKMILEKKTKE